MWVWNQTFFQTRFSQSFIHSHEHGFSLSCSIDGCKKNAVIDSYLKHIKRKHNNFNQEHLSKSRDHARNDTILNLLIEVHEVAEYDHDHMGEEDIEIGETEIDFQKKVCSYIFEKKTKLLFIVIP